MRAVQSWLAFIVQHNQAYFAAVYIPMALLVTGTRFISNSSSWVGGGLYASGSCSLSNSQFISNSTLYNGGGAYGYAE